MALKLKGIKVQVKFLEAMRTKSKERFLKAHKEYRGLEHLLSDRFMFEKLVEFYNQ